MAAFGIGPLIVASIGIILMGLLRTPLRWSGAAVLLVAVVWAMRVPQPDILISGDGRNVAVRGADGRLHLMRAAKDALPGQGVAGGGCRCADGGGCLARRGRVLRCERLRDASRRRRASSRWRCGPRRWRTIANAPR